MKNILTLFCLTSLIFLLSCGYKVLNNVNNTNFEIVEIDVKGNDKINNKLEKFFSRYKNKENPSRLFDIQLDSFFTKCFPINPSLPVMTIMTSIIVYINFNRIKMPIYR